MEIIGVTPENISAEHICCSISDKKGELCVSSKKNWMLERFQDGLVFKKMDARGKAFIEYMPAEKAWCPIDAAGYMHINCFWISGALKGQGYANRLLNACVADAKAQRMHGITCVSSGKKMAFLSDPGYLKHKGFRVADTAEPYYQLLYLPFDESGPVPAFRACAKEGRIDEKGMTLYYANQCPYAEKYALMIGEAAERNGAKVKLIKLETMEQAQNAPAPFTSYSFFDGGALVTNEIFSEKKFEKYMRDK